MRAGEQILSRIFRPVHAWTSPGFDPAYPRLRVDEVFHVWEEAGREVRTQAAGVARNVIKAGQDVRSSIRYELANQLVTGLHHRAGIQVRIDVESRVWDPIEGLVSDSVRAPVWGQIWPDLMEVER